MTPRTSIMRTIQASEAAYWRTDLESPAQRQGNYPTKPVTFPFRGSFRQTPNDYLYVVFEGEVRWYGRIRRVFPHGGTPVGSQGQIVGPGDCVELDGHLHRMQQPVKMRGFHGFRYVSGPLAATLAAARGDGS